MRRGWHPAVGRGRRQRGITLVISLIMLVALALIATSAFKGSTTNLRTVGNAQSRQEAFAAAQTALETTISSSQFVENPLAVAASPVNVDVVGNGDANFVVRISPAPACYRVRPVSAGELNPAVASDLPCLLSQRPSGIESDIPGPASGASLCSDMEWNVRAVVADPVSTTQLAANQGIAVRGLVTDAASNCP